jgi:phage terminase small subunit
MAKTRVPRQILNKQGLNPRQEKFVYEYLLCLNARQAAVAAGYSGKRVGVLASRMIRSPAIAKAIAAGKARQLKRTDLSAERVLEELRRLAFMDPRRVFDAVGNLLPVKDWPTELSSSLASFEVIKKNAVAGDGHIDVIHKVKFWDKPKSLEMLAKHFALLVERVENSGGITVQWLPAEISASIPAESVKRLPAHTEPPTLPEPSSD